MKKSFVHAQKLSPAGLNGKGKERGKNQFYRHKYVYFSLEKMQDNTDVLVALCVTQLKTDERGKF